MFWWVACICVCVEYNNSSANFHILYRSVIGELFDLKKQWMNNNSANFTSSFHNM